MKHLKAPGNLYKQASGYTHHSWETDREEPTFQNSGTIKGYRVDRSEHPKVWHEASPCQALGSRTMPSKATARFDHFAKRQPRRIKIVGDYGMMTPMLIEILYFSKRIQTDV